MPPGKITYKGISRIENDSIIHAGEVRLSLKSISRLEINYLPDNAMAVLDGKDMITGPAPMVYDPEGALFFLPTGILAASIGGGEPGGRTYLCNVYGEKKGWGFSACTFIRPRGQR